MAQRELEIFSSCRHFMGRNPWHKAVARLYAPQANYFHCDEVIRDFFDLTNNPDKLMSVSKKSIEVAHNRHNRSNIKACLIGIYTSIVSKT